VTKQQTSCEVLHTFQDLINCS